MASPGFDEYLDGCLEIMACADGPILVRRTDDVLDSELGNGRRVIALCRCKKSLLLPLCDGTHKMINAHNERIRQESSMPEPA